MIGTAEAKSAGQLHIQDFFRPLGDEQRESQTRERFTDHTSKLRLMRVRQKQFSFEVEVYYVTSWDEQLITMRACYTILWSRGALGARKPTFQSPVLTGFRRSRFC